MMCGSEFTLVLAILFVWVLVYTQLYTLQQWTSGLGFAIKEGWRAWIVLDQVGTQ